jgi:hypothetical protein
VLVAGLCATSASPSLAEGLSWDKAFGGRATKPDLHLVARSEDLAGGAHVLELWREGERRLRRRTDEALEVWSEDQGPAGAPAYALTVVDRRASTLRRLTVEGGVKLGPAFTWWPLAHLLPLPGPRYTLERLPERGLRVGSARCDWYRFVPAGLPEERICWSREYAVALRHEQKRGEGWWTRLSVEKVEPLGDKARAFQLDTTGLRVLSQPEPDDD